MKNTKKEVYTIVLVIFKACIYQTGINGIIFLKVNIWICDNQTRHKKDKFIP